MQYARQITTAHTPPCPTNAGTVEYLSIVALYTSGSIAVQLCYLYRYTCSTLVQTLSYLGMCMLRYKSTLLVCKPSGRGATKGLCRQRYGSCILAGETGSLSSAG